MDDNVAATHDVATQQIIYGKATISGTDSSVYNSTDKYYHKTVSFATGVTFSSPPFITATVNNGSTSLDKKNVDAIVTTYNITNNGFGIRVKRSGTTATYDTPLVIHWIAIGPR